MESDLKNLKDLEIFLNQNKVFDFFGVEDIGVFGSFARGEIANDIDLLISTAKNRKQVFELKNKLTEKSSIKFDLVYEEFADPIILNRAKKDLVHVKKFQG